MGKGHSFHISVPIMGMMPMSLLELLVDCFGNNGHDIVMQIIFVELLISHFSCYPYLLASLIAIFYSSFIFSEQWSSAHFMWWRKCFDDLAL